MTYTFKCGTCSESFNVYSENLIKKENLICPNCGNRLPDVLFEKLRTAAKLLNEVDENSTKLDGVITRSNPNHFYYKIQQSES